MGALLLWKLKNNEHIVHGANHDIESFIWVLSFCVMSNLYFQASHIDAPKDVQDQYWDFRTLFGIAFGETDLSKLVQARQTYSVALTFPEYGDTQQITARFMSEALVYLFEDLQRLVAYASLPDGSILLTHDSLLASVNNAIAKLEEATTSTPLTVPDSSQSD
jgi:hypothetical protein